MAFEKKSKEEIALAAEAQKKALNERIKALSENFKMNPEVIVDYLKFSSQFYNYSQRNQQLIFSQNENATFVGSFKHYKDKGYSVKSGEHGLKISVPVTTTMLQIGEHEWKKLSEATKAEKEKAKNGQINTRQVRNYKIGSVFDISQTTVPPSEYPKFFSMGYPSEQHKTVFEGVKQYCENELKCPVEITDLKSISLHGYYIPEQHKIAINELLEDSDRLVTTLHEMGHAIMHDEKALQEKPLEQIEFEADSIAVMLQNKFGFDFEKDEHSHMANQYQRLKEKDKDFDFDKVLNNVSDVFSEHIDKLTDYVDAHLNRAKEMYPKKAAENSNAIQEYCKQMQKTGKDLIMDMER